ncbi:DUF881 domain-containing protein [Demetria terragena]|uniref:DUF881 domain-containing protein n=1 Tax=Demetria terragena TaxID=63959 RepID=UPI00036BDE4D|nr:DUF881 domain-containing protein [Demetria terragena]
MADTESPRTTPWSRLRRMGAPRATRANVIAGVLAMMLGFAMVTQVRETRTSGLENLRQSDLVALLGSVNNQSGRLSKEVQDLTRTRDQLRSGSSGAAEKAVTQRAATLGILAGTTAATGQGITISVQDAGGTVKAPDLLDAIQELRDAGAEAIQVNDARIIASTWFGTDSEKQIVIDGKVVRAPYTIRAIGDAHTMATAMAIPGGVQESLERAGARVEVTSEKKVDVTALRPSKAPDYARPNGEG